MEVGVGLAGDSEKGVAKVGEGVDAMARRHELLPTQRQVLAVLALDGVRDEHRSRRSRRQTVTSASGGCCVYGP